MAKKGRQGFASLTPEKRREIARQGGKAAQAQGVGHKWTPAEAKAAGRKGGLNRHKKPKTFTQPIGDCQDGAA